MDKFNQELIEKKRSREKAYEESIKIKRVKSNNFSYKLSFEHAKTNDTLVEEMNRQDEIKMMSENDFDSMDDKQLASKIIDYSTLKPCPPADEDYKKCNDLECLYCYPYLPGSEFKIVEQMRKKRTKKLKKREKTFSMRKSELSKLVSVFEQEDVEDTSQEFKKREIEIGDKKMIISDRAWLNYLERESGIQSSFETIEESYSWISKNWEDLSRRKIMINFFGEKYILNRRMNNPQFILKRDITVILTWYDYWVECPDFYNFGDTYLPMPLELLKLISGESKATEFNRELKEIIIPLRNHGYLDEDFTDIWLN